MDKEHMESNEQQTEVAATQVQEVKVNKVNVLGLVGFILSIISLFLSVFGVVPLAALVLSIVNTKIQFFVQIFKKSLKYSKKKKRSIFS